MFLHLVEMDKLMLLSKNQYLFYRVFLFRSLLEAGGVDRLMNITRQRNKFTSRVVKFASQVWYLMVFLSLGEYDVLF